MSSMTIWANAHYLDIDGSAEPNSYGDGVGGETNEVAAIRIKRQHDDESIIIEGRPDELLEVAREILRTAELIAEQTMRDPELRRLYGITETGSRARIVGVSLDTNGLGRIKRGES